MKQSKYFPGQDTINTIVNKKNMVRLSVHTLKKFSNDGSSGASAVVETVGDGSRGPSITDRLGTASSSSNSLLENNIQIERAKSQAGNIWHNISNFQSIISHS